MQHTALVFVLATGGGVVTGKERKREYCTVVVMGLSVRVAKST